MGQKNGKNTNLKLIAQEGVQKVNFLGHPLFFMKDSSFVKQAEGAEKMSQHLLFMYLPF